MYRASRRARGNWRSPGAYTFICGAGTIISGMSGPGEERQEVVAALGQAVLRLEEAMAGTLVAPGGSNIAYAIRGARTSGDVAAVAGGLHEEGGRVRPAGAVGFGADDAIAATLLTAMKFDPGVRCAARIRFSDEILGILRDMFIECATAGPAGRRENDRLFDFSVASCCTDGVPDVVVSGRDPRAPPVVWLFCEEPARCASNIIILSNRIQ